jgi:hypothetical protein
MRPKLLLASLAVGSLAAGLAAAAPVTRSVVAALVASPLEPDEQADRVITPDEPFMRQRLTALKSATLTADVQVPTHDGLVRYQTTSTVLPKGTRLVLAVGNKGVGGQAVGDGTEYYCASYSIGAVQALAIGKWKVQWVCFEDTDKDGVFDQVYATPKDATLVVPSFLAISDPKPVKAPYAVDPDDARYHFERAVARAKPFLYGPPNFIEKARRQDDADWGDFDPSNSGIEGWRATPKGGGYPAEVELNGMAFTLLGKAGNDGLSVRPGKVRTGIIFFGVVYR